MVGGVVLRLQLLVLLLLLPLGLVVLLLLLVLLLLVLLLLVLVVVVVAQRRHGCSCHRCGGPDLRYETPGAAARRGRGHVLLVLVLLRHVGREPRGVHVVRLVRMVVGRGRGGVRHRSSSASRSSRGKGRGWRWGGCARCDGRRLAPEPGGAEQRLPGRCWIGVMWEVGGRGALHVVMVSESPCVSLTSKHTQARRRGVTSDADGTKQATDTLDDDAS
jgi:hypothetical protein